MYLQSLLFIVYIIVLHSYFFFHSDLKEKVKALNTGGTTALGPSLSLCVGMTSNYPSSEIILCTDGLSNVGVGNLESGNPDQEFYATVSTYSDV